MGYEMNLSDRQWFNLLCGMNAGMMVKNRRSAFSRTAVTTYIVGNPLVNMPPVILGVEGLDCLNEDAFNTETNYKIVTGLDGIHTQTEDFTQAGYMNHEFSTYPGFNIYGGGSEPQTIDWLRWGVMLYFPENTAVHELSFTIYLGQDDGSRMYPASYVTQFNFDAEWNSNIAQYFDIEWSNVATNIVGIKFKMTIREEGSSLMFPQGSYELGIFKVGSFHTRARGTFNQMTVWRQGACVPFLKLNDETVIEMRPDKVYYANDGKQCGINFGLANYEECLVFEHLGSELVYEGDSETVTLDSTKFVMKDVVLGKEVIPATSLVGLSQEIIDGIIEKYNGQLEYLWVVRPQAGGWGIIDVQTDNTSAEGYSQTTLLPQSVELAEVDVTCLGADSNYIDGLIAVGAIEGTRPALSWSSTEITPFFQAINKFGSVTYEGNLSVDRSCTVYLFIADENGEQVSVSVPVELSKGVNKIKVVIPLLCYEELCGEYTVHSSLYYVVDDNGFGEKPEGTAALAGATVTTQGTASAPAFPVRPVGEDKITLKDVLHVEVYDIPVPRDIDIDDTVYVEDDIDVDSRTEFDGEVSVSDNVVVSDDIDAKVKTEFNGTVEETAEVGVIDETAN